MQSCGTSQPVGEQYTLYLRNGLVMHVWQILALMKDNGAMAAGGFLSLAAPRVGYIKIYAVFVLSSLVLGARVDDCRGGRTL